MNERSTRIPALCILLLFMLAVPVPRSFAEEPHPLNDSVQELMRRGEYEKALEQLKQTFNLFPYDESTRRNLAAVYAAIGRRQLDRKEFDEAAKSFDDARKLIPENRDYPILRGIALYSGKRYDEAAIVLEQELRNGGENVPLFYYLGCVYYYTGDLAKALEVWEKVLAIEPENKAVRQMISKARRESAVESRMKNEYGSIFVISYDEGTKSDLADAVRDVLETAYNRVGSDLSHFPVVRIPVILYTRKDYRIVTAGPAWSGGLYDGKVRLPIGGATEITPALRAVLFHEYTHVLVAELTKGNCPVWLTEGLAEFEGRKEYDPPTTELEKAAKTGGFLPFNTIEKSLSSLAASDAALAYQQSWSMVDFMISAYGLHKVRELLVNLGGGIGINAAIAATFADYGLDYQAIMDEWKAAMRKKYGK
ncbi:MAG TPA: tetratricopeptide repeat protein [Geobacteraceae bacterium]|nr:tetratricopeptide repeat protein [Geobacteraceae bacterium]